MSQNTLHPLLAEILAAHGMPNSVQVGVDSEMSRQREYAAALERFDWQFTFSDDYSYVQTQRAILKIIQAEQAAIDPAFEIWNAHTPVENWNGRVIL